MPDSKRCLVSAALAGFAAAAAPLPAAAQTPKREVVQIEAHPGTLVRWSAPGTKRCGKVRSGEDVKKGQALGLVGSTGRATGPHLHLGIRWHGARIDPQPLLGDPAKIPAVAP